jgi:hypothetical protein
VRAGFTSLFVLIALTVFLGGCDEKCKCKPGERNTAFPHVLMGCDCQPSANNPVANAPTGPAVTCAATPHRIDLNHCPNSGDLYSLDNYCTPAEMKGVYLAKLGEDGVSWKCVSEEPLSLSTPGILGCSGTTPNRFRWEIRNKSDPSCGSQSELPVASLLVMGKSAANAPTAYKSCETVCNDGDPECTYVDLALASSQVSKATRNLVATVLSGDTAEFASGDLTATYSAADSCGRGPLQIDSTGVKNESQVDECQISIELANKPYLFVTLPMKMSLVAQPGSVPLKSIDYAAPLDEHRIVVKRSGSDLPTDRGVISAIQVRPTASYVDLITADNGRMCLGVSYAK